MAERLNCQVLASSFHVQDACEGLLCSPASCSVAQASGGGARVLQEAVLRWFFCKCPLLIISPLPSRSQAGVLEMWKPLPLRTQRCEPAVTPHTCSPSPGPCLGGFCPLWGEMLLEPALGLFHLSQLFNVCRCAHELPGGTAFTKAKYSTSTQVY